MLNKSNKMSKKGKKGAGCVEKFGVPDGTSASPEEDKSDSKPNPSRIPYSSFSASVAAAVKDSSIHLGSKFKEIRYDSVSLGVLRSSSGNGDYDGDDDVNCFAPEEISPSVAASPPSLSIESSEPDAALYTVVMTYPNPPNRDTPSLLGEFVHWVVVNIAKGEGENIASSLSSGETAAPYVGPRPLNNPGKHIYYFLLFKQSFRLDVSAVAEHFKIRSGVETQTWAAENNLGRVLDAKMFESQWDLSEDQLHKSLGFLPPPQYLSSSQKSVGVDSAFKNELMDGGSTASAGIWCWSLRSWILFFIVYTILHLTAFPSVPGGDSGELLAEACVHGVAHPPGYPLFLILSELFGRLPIPRVFLTGADSDAGSSASSYSFYLNDRISVELNPTYAWKVNNLCCVSAALAAVLIAQTSSQIFTRIYKLNVKRSGSKDQSPSSGVISFVLAPIMYCCSPLVWEYSTTSEVFALNNLLCAALVYIALRVFSEDSWVEGRGRAVFNMTLLGAFVSGLSLCNQHSSMLFLAPIVPLIAYKNFSKLSSSEFTRISLLSVLVFLLALSPYATLALASRRESSKGSWGDLTSLHGFLRHFLRSEYGTFQLGLTKGSEGFLERLVYYAKHSSRETGHLVFPGLALAVASLFSRSRSASGEVTVYGKSNSNSSNSNQSNSKNSNNSNSNNNSKKVSKINQQRSSYNSNSSSSTSTSNSNPVVVIPPTTKLPASSPSSYSSDSDISAPLVLLFTFLFYVIIWHGLFSNLPMSAPMPYGVHARFWMQPHIILCVFSAAGLEIAISKGLALIGSSGSSGSSVGKRNLKQTILVILLGLLLKIFVVNPFHLMDRSKTGWIMHKYAELTLNALPLGSLLISHTDLDWNTIRYLRNCEKHRPDLAHLSFQIMPYPWFATRQMRQYEDEDKITFPDLNFKGITTDRFSEGNAKLVHSFVAANGAQQINVTGLVSSRNKEGIEGGIFVDFQSIGNVGWDSLGLFWYDLLLMPWGTQYRVYSSSLTFFEILSLHVQSHKQVLALEVGFPAIDVNLVRQYPAGSWEFAAASVMTDAKYNLAIHLVAFTSNKADFTVESLPYVLNRLHFSSQLLLEVQRRTHDFGTISSPTGDIDKNTALSWMRLMSYLKIAVDIERKSPGSFSRQVKQSLLVPIAGYQDLITLDKYNEICPIALRIIRRFVETYPSDPNINAFSQVLSSKWTLE